jgi:hypothetical protein
MYIFPGGDSMQSRTIDEVIGSIVKTTQDYKNGIIMTNEHVEFWISQFTKEYRHIILKEMDNILRKFYVNKETVRQYLKALLNTKEIVGESFLDNYKTIKFLDIQRKGESQKELLGLMNEILIEEYGIHISQCGTTPYIYIYLDDCMFSGNTVYRDIENWVNYNHPSSNSQVHFVFIGLHTRNFNYIFQKIGEILNPLSVTFLFWRMKEIKDSRYYGVEEYECLLPTSMNFDPLTMDYIRNVDAQRTENQKASYPLLRDEGFPRKETLFTSPMNRKIVEKEFLEKGVYLKSLGSTNRENIRPLGYDYLKTLGFGSMFITYRNISNNCPLVLWWGDPSGHYPLNKWYPLFPRKVNEG